ncbi:dUTP diphosphatase [Bacillus sp. ISL-7]|uniref:dUTP diphosphatase n=1 Tax=Bacillus sp. ISL-7 TaxID=2819136 RepID=UPI001BE78BE8|nr:dUTP diphosphatase [Bacillus sp. ISL-7]MBT2735155.1 dUTP diphosphatase [Bacillus sp. ISL-7]
MNLNKLFEIQKVLRDRIGYNEPDRFNKLILALLVELGECANEWRGFKFWSVNQLPHTSAVRVPCMMEEDKEFYNPLLEEYVDKLHFILEIGLEFNFTDIDVLSVKEKDITIQYIECTGRAYNLYFHNRVTGEVPKVMYEHLFSVFIGLGEMLGFTWEQIEQAYLEKNRENHRRQEVGY